MHKQNEAKIYAYSTYSTVESFTFRLLKHDRRAERLSSECISAPAHPSRGMTLHRRKVTIIITLWNISTDKTLREKESKTSATLNGMIIYSVQDIKQMIDDNLSISDYPFFNDIIN